jgi:hypothetical protein
MGNLVTRGLLQILVVAPPSHVQGGYAWWRLPAMARVYSERRRNTQRWTVPAFLYEHVTKMTVRPSTLGYESDWVDRLQDKLVDADGTGPEFRPVLVSWPCRAEPTYVAHSKSKVIEKLKREKGEMNECIQISGQLREHTGLTLHRIRASTSLKPLF